MEVAVRVVGIWHEYDASKVAMTAAERHAILLRILRRAQSYFLSKLCGNAGQQMFLPR